MNLEELVKLAEKPYPCPDDSKEYHEWMNAHLALDTPCALPMAKRLIETQKALRTLAETTHAMTCVASHKFDECVYPDKTWFHEAGKALND